MSLLRKEKLVGVVTSLPTFCDDDYNLLLGRPGVSGDGGSLLDTSPKELRGPPSGRKPGTALRPSLRRCQVNVGRAILR